MNKKLTAQCFVEHVQRKIHKCATEHASQPTEHVSWPTKHVSCQLKTYIWQYMFLSEHFGKNVVYVKIKNMFSGQLNMHVGQKLK